MIIKHALIICLVVIFFCAFAYGRQIKHNNMGTIQDNINYTVWTTYNLHFDDGERYSLSPNNELILSLPVSVKAIIARYTMFLPDYLFEKEEETALHLARALGDFNTLEEAQQTLLKDWKGENIVMFSGFPGTLEFRETEHSLFFEYGTMYHGRERVTDEFKVDKDGRIACFPQPEPREKIPYCRKTLLDKYNRFMLNGELVEHFNFLYLDADNVKSVEANNRDRIVYIEQKNKNPDYFVRSDIANHLDSLAAFKVKSLDEIELIVIQDYMIKNYAHEFTEFDKIETSAIKSLSSSVLEEYDIKVVAVVLK